MKTELCQAHWHNKKGAGCSATFPTTELGEFTKLRWRQRQPTSAYYVQPDGSLDRDDRAAVVWQGTDRRWQYCWWAE
jgi:hypothetical protein